MAFAPKAFVTGEDSTGAEQVAQVLTSAGAGTERGLAVHVVSQPASGGGLTDAELRASPVPVSGTVSITGTVTVAGAKTNNTAAPGATNVGALGAIANAAVPTYTEGNLVLQSTDLSGRTRVDATLGKTLKSASFSLAATGTVVAAVPTKRIKVYAVKLVASAAMTVNFRDGGATALEGSQSLAANGGFTESVSAPCFLFGTTAGNSLDLVLAGGTAAGRVSYWDDDAT